jgi:aerobic-type carbon monoxide dehydrogenase small subunit (CoxS/CutS family)
MSSKDTQHPNPTSLVPDEQPSAGDPGRNSITRRGFLKGAGLTAAGSALLDGVKAFGRETTQVANHGVTEFGPTATSVQLNVNGKEHSVEIEPRTTLAEALRIQMGMTGTKIVCDRGTCSACTVWLDKVPINSCTTLVIDAVGHNVTTIEGLSPNGGLSPLQAAFVKHDALQCGFCTPGMVMSCAALLQSNPHPTEADVRRATAGNLCRCGTYPRVFTATLEVAGNNHKA